MRKLLSLFIVSAACANISLGQTTYFVPPKGVPRNVIVIMANGMGMNQVAAATLKKGAPLSFSGFQVTGFTQAWQPNGDQPNDSLAAVELFTNTLQKNDPYAKQNKSPRLMELARDKKMLTGLVTTAPVTGTAPKIISLDNYLKKDNETLAQDYIKTDLNVLIGGGAKYFNLRYDGKNLMGDLKNRGYKIITKTSGLGNLGSNKAIGLVEKNGLYRAGDRNDYLTKATLGAIKAMNDNNGYFLVVDDTKIEEADSLNNIQLLDEEMLDLDKMVNEIALQAGDETLILVIGNYESGGLMLKNARIAPKAEPEVTWTGKYPTAALAPVFAKGPSAQSFTGVYTQADIFKKLEEMMVVRR